MMTDIDKVKVLVEWVAEKMCIIDGNEWGFVNDTTKTLFDGAPSKSIYRGRAKQILSHPDLALIDRGKGRNTPQRGTHVCANCWISTQNDMLTAGFEKVIPLAPAIKEE